MQYVRLWDILGKEALGEAVAPRLDNHLPRAPGTKSVRSKGSPQKLLPTCTATLRGDKIQACTKRMVLGKKHRAVAELKKKWSKRPLEISVVPSS